MKKSLTLTGLVLSVVFLFGCSLNNESANNINNTPTSAAASIQDYFPINENVRYDYEGKGIEYASYDVYIDYATEGKVQQRISNGGTVTAKVFEIKDGKLTCLLSRAEAYYRENLMNAKSENEEVLLMEPLVKGTTWTLKDSKTRTITAVSTDVTTPSGKYKAIEVTTKGPDGKTTDYYAKDVGLVKTIFSSGEFEVSSSLSKVEENVLLKQKINFYFPTSADSKIHYKSKEIAFKTNDITRRVLETAYKDTANNNNGKALSTNTKINSLYLNKDNMVYIDLNSSMLSEMNAGSLYEELILLSIANTFGHYYGSDKVILTIDNNLYRSGHIAMEKGQYIKTKYDDTVEIK